VAYPRRAMLRVASMLRPRTTDTPPVRTRRLPARKSYCPPGRPEAAFLLSRQAQDFRILRRGHAAVLFEKLGSSPHDRFLWLCQTIALEEPFELCLLRLREIVVPRRGGRS
jgi:hypothetical protein